MTRETRIVHKCSFCEKDQYESKNIIAGPNGVDICDECVYVCVEILEKGQEESK